LIPPANHDTNYDSNKYVQSLHRDCVGKSIRKGASNLITRHLGVETAVTYGNWEKSYSSMLEYYDLVDSERMDAARILAGWKKSIGAAYPPRCVFVEDFNDTERIKFNNYLVRMLNISYPVILHGQMHLFPRYLLASFLYHFKEFEATYGTAHVICKHFYECNRQFGYSNALILAWVEAVRKDYLLRNDISHIDTTNEVLHLQGTVSLLRSEVSIKFSAVLILVIVKRCVL